MGHPTEYRQPHYHEQIEPAPSFDWENAGQTVLPQYASRNHLNPINLIPHAAPPYLKNNPLSLLGHLTRLSSKLTVVKVGVEFAQLHQFIMAALFNDGAIFHHKDMVGVPDGGKPVGDNKAGSAFH